MKKFRFSFIGTGNAWPVTISKDHPFYDHKDYMQLANASYQVEKITDDTFSGKILIDAGHGVIPYLLNDGNHLPEALILTHPHADHTVSVDWICHSYAKVHNKEKFLPLYCTSLCYQKLIQTFPNLSKFLDFRELSPGKTVILKEINELSLTAYPVFHGNAAPGASMIRIDIENKPEVLLSGDCLVPMLRNKDYEQLQSIPYFISDANNRFPYPRSNHWSVVSTNPDGSREDKFLPGFINDLKLSGMLTQHIESSGSPGILEYFDEWLNNADKESFKFSFYDFCNAIRPANAFAVHYSGGEDEKYYKAPRLDRHGFKEWLRSLDSPSTQFLLPSPGESFVI